VAAAPLRVGGTGRPRSPRLSFGMRGERGKRRRTRVGSSMRASPPRPSMRRCAAMVMPEDRAALFRGLRACAQSVLPPSATTIIAVSTKHPECCPAVPSLHILICLTCYDTTTSRSAMRQTTVPCTVPSSRRGRAPTRHIDSRVTAPERAERERCARRRTPLINSVYHIRCIGHYLTCYSLLWMEIRRDEYISNSMLFVTRRRASPELTPHKQHGPLGH
jgi:hypothetical protein